MPIGTQQEILVHTGFGIYIETKIQFREYNNLQRVSDDFFFFPGATQPIVGAYFTALYRALASSRTRLLDHTTTRHSR